MAIKYDPTPWDFHTEGPSLTEQEHADSCDINKMVKNAMRGMDVRGSIPGNYGYDDTTMDGLTFRMEKQRLEQELASGPKEFEEEEFKLIPKSIAEKFGFTKKATKQANTNDDKTTNTNALQTPQNEPATTLPTPSTNAQ